MNGDRYIFASTGFDPPLPEKALIGDHMCRIWYASRRVVQCDRCNGGHSSFDKVRCPLYIVPLDNVYVFTRGLLSNFGKCTVNMGPLTFPSSEHAYQFRACEEHISVLTLLNLSTRLKLRRKPKQLLLKSNPQT